MNLSQLHVILTHFPLAGFLGSLLLLGFALWRGREETRNIALTGIFLSGVLTLLLLPTGEAAEDLLENIGGVSKSLMERHEELGEITAWLAFFSGMVALVTLFVQKWKPVWMRIGTAAVVLSGLAALVAVGYTGHLGGQIRRPELTSTLVNGVESLRKYPAALSDGGEHRKSKGRRGHDEHKKDHDDRD